jgi:pyrroloquinoline quinone biosynthesis protein B
MRIIVLGAGAGGGVPQWNANNRISSAAFRASPAVPRLTQTGLAASADGEQWLLLNASPDLRAQIVATPSLHPKAPAVRNSPIRAVALANADIDAIAGLLTLRERERWTLYATPYVLGVLDRNPVFEALDRDLVTRRAIALDRPFEPVPGLSVLPFETPGKPPLFAEAAEGHATRADGGHCLGFVLEDLETGKRACVAPSCAQATADVMAAAAGVDALFFDGTLFTDTEMLRSGEGEKTGRRMGHMPMTGPGGSVEAFRGAAIPQKFFIHINNTNPSLMRGSIERRELEAAGWRIAEDGMEVVL